MSPPAEESAPRKGGRRRARWVRTLLSVALLAVLAVMVLPPYWFGMAATPPHVLKARLARGEADLTVVDVRTGAEFRAGHIPGAVPLPLHALPFRLGTLAGERDKELILVCLSGHRSRLAGLLLKLAGFDRVTNLEGGMAAWRVHGYRSAIPAGPDGP